MNKKIFVSIREASNLTGLSQFYLRSGCRNGTLPYVMCGNRYKINLPALVEQMAKESATKTTRKEV